VPREHPGVPGGDLAGVQRDRRDGALVDKTSTRRPTSDGSNE